MHKIGKQKPGLQNITYINIFVYVLLSECLILYLQCKMRK